MGWGVFSRSFWSEKLSYQEGNEQEMPLDLSKEKPPGSSLYACKPMCMYTMHV